MPAACTLLTGQDASALLGTANVGAGTSSTPANCGYTVTGTALQPIATAQILVDHYPSAQQARTIYTETHTLNAATGTVQDVSDLGDAAHIWQLGIVVLKGSIVFTIGAMPVGATTPSAAAYRQAAEAVLRRLG